VTPSGITQLDTAPQTLIQSTRTLDDLSVIEREEKLEHWEDEKEPYSRFFLGVFSSHGERFWMSHRMFRRISKGVFGY
jgi:hypothetical protein